MPAACPLRSRIIVLSLSIGTCWYCTCSPNVLYTVISYSEGAARPKSSVSCPLVGVGYTENMCVNDRSSMPTMEHRLELCRGKREPFSTAHILVFCPAVNIYMHASSV